jgi:hypothetical protein
LLLFRTLDVVCNWSDLRFLFVTNLNSPIAVQSLRRVAALLKPYQGLVSRVTPVQTAMRNCTRDEGRSFEFGNQVLISSHRKLLWSKAMVVSVAEKSGRDPVRQC